MPHILRDVNPIVATLLTQHRILYDRAIIIVSSHPSLASQDYERLILCRMPMDGYHSPWLHGIQHPMTFILQRLISPMPDYGRCPQSMQNGAKGGLARLSEGGGKVNRPQCLLLNPLQESIRPARIKHLIAVHHRH